MIVFRIAQERYIRDITGTGARLFGGRWNSKGNAILYTSENRSLSMLETMVHTPQRFMPKDLFISSIFIPDEAPSRAYKVAEMPEGWRDYPAPANLVNFGDQFLSDMKFLFIKVPSSVLKEEFNILVNPLHADFRKVEQKEIQPFQFDMRLFPKTENPA